MPNWRQFLDEIKKEPKDCFKAIIKNLEPPKYAVEEIKSLECLCHFCWKPRMDFCFKCMRSICAEHTALTIVGEKTKLEWYVCPDCLRAHSEEDLRKEVAEQDGEFWLEDQEL